MTFDCIYIYTLVDKKTNNPFYVGSTKWSLENRLYQHILGVKRLSYNVHRYIAENSIDFEIKLYSTIEYCGLSKRHKVEMEIAKKLMKEGYSIQNSLGIIKPNKKSVKLFTIKVTRETARNFNIASALSGKTQYEVSEEGSEFVLGKYMSKKAK